MKNLASAIQILYPDAWAGPKDDGGLPDFEVVDRQDGNGPQLVAWRLLVPRPTIPQLETASVLADKKAWKSTLDSECNAKIKNLFDENEDVSLVAALNPQDPRLTQARSITNQKNKEKDAISKMPSGKIKSSNSLDALRGKFQ